MAFSFPLALQEADVPELAPLQGILLGVLLVAASWFALQYWVKPKLFQLAEAEPIAYHVSHVFAGGLMYLGVMALLGVGLYAAYGESGIADMPVLASLLFAALTHGVVVLGLAWLVKSLKGRARHVGLDDPSPMRSYGWGVVLYLCAVPALIGASILWSVILGFAGRTMEQQDIAAGMLQSEGIMQRGAILALATFVIPFLEEFLFRGFMQTWLVKTLGYLPGLLLASSVFAALHGLSPFGPLMVVAIVSGLGLHWTRSLWTAVGVHASNNAVSTILLFANPEFFQG